MRMGSVAVIARFIMTVATAVALGTAAFAEQTVLKTPAPSAQSIAVADALTSADAASLQEFYESRAFMPIWAEDRERVLDLIDALRAAGDHAIPVPHDTISTLTAMVEADAPQERELAQLEIAASLAFVDFAQDLNSGVLVPSKVDREIAVKPKVQGASALLRFASSAAELPDILRVLAPKDPVYWRLIEERRRLEGIISAGGWGEAVPARKTLRPGRSSSAVSALRARLGRLGYGDLGADPSYDVELITVVKLFQTRHGLNADGVAGPATLAAINATPEQRLSQVVVNLERQRWLNLDRGKRHIYVNLADYSVQVIDDGEVSFTSRVVIGKTGEDFRTPEFNHVMTHLVVNPFWHVPESIAEREYLPMLKADPLALAKRGMQLLNRRGQVLDTTGADFSQFSEDYFPFMIKQPPGGRNALGRVKFMFPNRHNIYLHDTPAKKLFRRDRRVYSHGCVRVQRPFDLAYHLLAKQFKYPEATFRKYLKRGREKYVYLKEPVPVYLAYNSAWVDDQGIPQYRGDVYRRDRFILRALEASGVALSHLDG